MIKILISGYLGFDNSGDESILQAISTSIKASNRPIQLTAFSSNPKKTSKNHGIKSLHSFNPISVLRGVIGTDIIISGGGNLLQDKTSSRSIWYYLMIIFLGKLFGKKVMLYSNGVGPLTKPINQRLVKGIINKVDIITLREGLSKEMLEALGVTKPPIFVTADPVFLLLPEEKNHTKELLKEEKITLEKKTMGVSVRKWHNVQQVKDFAQLCDEIVEEFDIDLVFIPMQFPQDLKVSEEIVKYMKNEAKIIGRQYTSNEQIGIIGHMDIVLSMRLHALIYAGIEAVPMIGLIYDPKIKYYLQQVNMPSIEDIHKINKAQIKEELTHLLSHYKTKKEDLVVRSADLKEKAKLNNEYLYQLINKNRGK